MLDGYSWLEPGNHGVTEISKEDFVAIKLEWNQQRRIFLVNQAEIFRHYADDLSRFAIHLERLSQNVSIAAKLALPV